MSLGNISRRLFNFENFQIFDNFRPKNVPFLAFFGLSQQFSQPVNMLEINLLYQKMPLGNISRRFFDFENFLIFYDFRPKNVHFLVLFHLN